MKKTFIHPTAEVHNSARVGANCRIWNWVQIRELASIGDNCIIAKGVYVDRGVVIGNQVKIQNNVSIYAGVTVEDAVFIGPHVCFTNDIYPRATTVDGHLRNDEEWEISKTRVCLGASIGASATILAGVTIGKYAMIGANSTVTRDVPDYSLVYGNAGALHGFVCMNGHRLDQNKFCRSCDFHLV